MMMTVNVLAKIQTERLSNISVQQQHTWLVGFRLVISSRIVRIPRTMQLCQYLKSEVLANSKGGGDSVVGIAAGHRLDGSRFELL